VEEAFHVKLTALGNADAAEIGTTHSSTVPNQPVAPEDGFGTQQARIIASGPIDKSLLAIPEPRRLRDKIHLRFVAKQPCLICGRRPCDAHHLRFAQSRGLGLKVSDEFTVPLCRGHHREVHRAGLEMQWWKTAAIDATSIARKFWIETHPIRDSVNTTDAVPPAPTATTEKEVGASAAPATRPTKRSQLPGLPT
jgi:hypothetical protein